VRVSRDVHTEAPQEALFKELAEGHFGRLVPGRVGAAEGVPIEWKAWHLLEDHGAHADLDHPEARRLAQVVAALAWAGALSIIARVFRRLQGRNPRGSVSGHGVRPYRRSGALMETIGEDIRGQEDENRWLESTADV